MNVKPIISKQKLFTLPVLLFALCLAPLQTVAQSIAINEVMASNSMTITDQDGDYEDWVELYNYGTEDVSLEGFGLSDDYDNPFRWVFPSVSMAPGEYLLIWASGKDRSPEEGWINGVMREVYSGITGSSLDDLTDHPDYPGNPSDRQLLTGGFEAPANVGNHYGQRLQSYIEAPETGDYIFWIASDDNSALYLSTDDDPGNIIEIAGVPGWTNSREWLKYPEQQSTTVMLEEGKRYYIKALMKEHEGGDNLAVRWRLPSGDMEEPIPNSRLYWNEAELHTSFKIDRAGEEVLLTSRDSVRIDELEPTELPADISYGRYPNGTGEFVYYFEPTPGEPNTGEGMAELPSVPDPPVFIPPGGPFTSSLTVGFEYDGGLEVYYTNDGTVPKPGVSRLYTQPFDISNTTVIRAITHEPGAASSETVMALYTRLTHSTSQFSSNLPLMVIHKFNQNIPEDRQRVPVYISLYDSGEDGRVRLDSDPALQSRAVINIRGSSSLMFPKKMYGFHLHDEDGSNRKEPLLGMPEEHNWILNGPYSDKSLMRNVIAYGLSNDIGRYAPRTRFIELYLHDGTGSLENAHYHGVYVLTERIKWADGRVEITKIDEDDNQEPEITGGYIFARDRLNTGESGFRTQRGSHFVHVRPQEEDISRQQRAWLENHLSKFETALSGDNFTDPKEGYAKYIDPDSFIDAHLVTELLKEIDGYRLSTFFFKDREGKINKGPLWDFNISMGNVDYYPDPQYTDNAFPEPWKPEGWYYALLSQNTYLYGWFTRLFEDQEFKARYVERWWQLRRGQFSDDSLKGRINYNAFILTEAQDRNFKRWPEVLNRYVWPNHYIAPTYNHEIAWITEWTTARTKWIDGQFGKPTMLLHFWHFNDLPPDEFFEVPADHTISNGQLTYTGSGDGYADRVNDGTLLNADLGAPAERALRVRNPSDTRELIFNIPTTGYKDVVFRYAVKRTANGARQQTVYYRAGDNDGWTLYSDTLEITETYRQFRFSFAGVEEADDNPQFSIRILFHGSETTGASGNNRFDNITLDGYSISDDEEDDPEPEAGAYHYNSQLYVFNPLEGAGQIEVFNIRGSLVGRFRAEGTGMHTFPFAPPSGIYIIRMINDRYVLRKKLYIHN